MDFSPGIKIIDNKKDLITTCVESFLKSWPESHEYTLVFPSKRGCHKFLNALKKIKWDHAPKKVFHIFDTESDETILKKPELPFIDETKRLALLSFLVGAAHEKLHIETNFKLSRSLADMLDNIYVNNYELSDIKKILDSDHNIIAKHWSKRKEFLDIIINSWEDLLNEENVTEKWSYLLSSIRNLDLSNFEDTYFIGFDESNAYTNILKEKINNSNNKTGMWVYEKKDIFSENFDKYNLNLIQESGTVEESRHIAKKCRDLLNDSKKNIKSIAIISPCEKFSHILTGALSQKEINANTTYTSTLPQSVTGSFVLLSANIISSFNDDLSWLSFAQHPLCYKGQRRYEFLRKLRKFDKDNLRGKVCNKWDELFDFYNDVYRSKELSLIECLNLHEKIMLDVCGETLWKNDDGKSSEEFFESIKKNATYYSQISSKNYGHFLHILMRGKKVFFEKNTTSSVNIISPQDSIFESYDAVFITNLNNKHWNIKTINNPWIPHNIQINCGILYDNTANYNFLNSLHSKNIFITRSEQEEGSPTIASAIWNILSIKNDIINGFEENNYDDEKVIIPPSFNPDIKYRPKKFSPTSFEMMIRNPYSYYAKYILNLYALQPLGYELNAMERGKIIHKILDIFIKDGNSFADKYAKEKLLSIMDIELSKFNENMVSFWREKLQEIFIWVIKESCKKKPSLCESEKKISNILNHFKYGKIELYGTADRVDYLEDSLINIIDYKTGTPPSKNYVEKFFSPQLPFLSYLLKKDLQKNICASYYHLSESNPKSINFNYEELSEAFEIFLKDAINHHLSSSYITSDKFSYTDYIHFERRQLWF